MHRALELTLLEFATEENLRVLVFLAAIFILVAGAGNDLGYSGELQHQHCAQTSSCFAGANIVPLSEGIHTY